MFVTGDLVIRNSHPAVVISAQRANTSPLGHDHQLAGFWVYYLLASTTGRIEGPLFPGEFYSA